MVRKRDKNEQASLELSEKSIQEKIIPKLFSNIKIIILDGIIN